MFTDDELDAIEKALEKATPGPWGWFPGCGPEPYGSLKAGGREILDLELTSHPYEEDAYLLENARQWLPALVAEVRRLRGS